MIRLGRFLGIEVSLHWTLGLLVLWSASSASLGSFFASAAFTVAIFACVLLHEFGHALAARQFGIHTPQITLYPIGGVATLEEMPRNPKHELWIAIAGPLVNVVIAGALFVLLPTMTLFFGQGIGQWLNYLIVANVGLVVFNLLPAFPMDGGRVFRAMIAMFTSYTEATQLAASVGKWMAILFAVLGVLYGHLMLIVIAGFVYLAGSAEANAVVREAFHTTAARPMRASWIRAARNGRVVTAMWDHEQSVYRVLPDTCV